MQPKKEPQLERARGSLLLLVSPKAARTIQLDLMQSNLDHGHASGEVMYVVDASVGDLSMRSKPNANRLCHR